MKKIPFSIPYTSSKSADCVQSLAKEPQLISNKFYLNKTIAYFEDLYPGYFALMTSSCTKALEIIALSLDFVEGDEVIMPSFNFVGVANSFVLAGATVVFADIEPNSMNICPKSIRRAVGPKTRAIVVMHYAGIACEMDAILEICQEYNITLIEDNAQGIHCKYNEQLLGSFGDYSCISFDTMKNVSCGEGGVLLFKEEYLNKVIETFDVGTNKKDFERGAVDKYEWVCLGSKYALSEYNAAILHPLLTLSEEVCKLRREKWDYLYQGFSSKPRLAQLLPVKLNKAQHQGHVFFIKCEDMNQRDLIISKLKESGITSAFHFSPLHRSPYALKHKLKIESDVHTTHESNRLLRLPIYANIGFDDLDGILEILEKQILSPL